MNEKRAERGAPLPKSSEPKWKPPYFVKMVSDRADGLARSLHCLLELLQVKPIEESGWNYSPETRELSYTTAILEEAKTLVAALEACDIPYKGHRAGRGENYVYTIPIKDFFRDTP